MEYPFSLYPVSLLFRLLYFWTKSSLEKPGEGICCIIDGPVASPFLHGSQIMLLLDERTG
jgi:hypothetical protein